MSVSPWVGHADYEVVVGRSEDETARPLSQQLAGHDIGELTELAAAHGYVSATRRAQGLGAAVNSTALPTATDKDLP